MFARYRDLPGKGGAMLRDSEVGAALKARLRKAQEEAAAQCPRVVRVERPPPAESK